MSEQFHRRTYKKVTDDAVLAVRETIAARHSRIDMIACHELSIRDISTILLTAGLLTVYFLPDSFLFHNPHSFCIHKYLLHFDCPGCGMTRSLHCFLHGQFRQAILFNIGIVPLVFLIVQYYFSYSIQSKSKDIFRKISVWLFTAALLTQYLLKAFQHFS